MPFRVYEGSVCLGISLPTEEFCVPLVSYRSVITHHLTQSYAIVNYSTCKCFSPHTTLTLLIRIYINKLALFCLCQSWAVLAACIGSWGRIRPLGGLHLQWGDSETRRVFAENLPSSRRQRSDDEGQHGSSSRCCDVTQHRGGVWQALGSAPVAHRPPPQPSAVPHHLQLEGRRPTV